MSGAVSNVLYMICKVAKAVNKQRIQDRRSQDIFLLWKLLIDLCLKDMLWVITSIYRNIFSAELHLGLWEQHMVAKNTVRLISRYLFHT